MPAPSGFKTPNILSVRPVHEWISRINHSHQRLSELAASSQAKTVLAEWAEVSFVYCTLALDGEEIPRNRISEIVRVGADAKTAHDSHRRAVNLLVGLREIEALAQAGRLASEMTGNLILHLRNIVVGGVSSESADARRAIESGDRRLAEVLDVACRWFGADSFAELNPVEQASIVHLRLIEILPFDDQRTPIAFLAASLFTIRSGLPPVILKPERAADYRSAREEGFRMNTGPMVALIAESILDALNEMIGLLEGRGK
jgi:hypothetical protein